MLQSNFNSVVVLGKGRIFLCDAKGKKYFMTLPTLRDQQENMDFNIFLDFCSKDDSEIAKLTNNVIKNKWQEYMYLKSSSNKVVFVLEKYFMKYMVDSKIVDDCLFWTNKLVNEQMFESFVLYCGIAMGVKSIEELKYVITEDMEEEEKRMILMEQKIQRTKRKNENSSGQVELNAVMSAIVKEFGYTYEQLYNSTLYEIYYMYSQIGAIMNYDIGLIACGNGLVDKKAKFNHWSIKNK